jgi:hypothetical protein
MVQTRRSQLLTDDHLEASSDNQRAFSPETVGDAGGGIYNISFPPRSAQHPRTNKLGLLTTYGKNELRERVCVQLVDPEADIFGRVTVGSMLIRINGEDVQTKTHTHALKMLRTAWEGYDAVKLTFKHGNFALEIQGGRILARMSSKMISVGSMRGGKASYQQKYYAFCEPKKLFMFEDKEQLEHAMIDDYNSRKLDTVEFYKLGDGSPLRCGEIKKKHYKAHGELYYFELKAPAVRYTAAKFACGSWEPLNLLRNSVQAALHPESVFSFPLESTTSPISSPVSNHKSFTGRESTVDTDLTHSVPVSFGRMRGSISDAYQKPESSLAVFKSRHQAQVVAPSSSPCSSPCF